MKDLNAQRFIQTVTLVSNIRAQIEQWSIEAKGELLTPEFRTFMANQFKDLSAATGFVGAELAHMAAERYRNELDNNSSVLSVDDMRVAIKDVETRLTDEVGLMGFMVLDRAQYGLLQPAAKLVDWDIERIFPDAARELSEASKCLALQRSTAAVFHAMRMLEVGIQKFSELLNIPDPVKPAERNWAIILSRIKGEIDTKYPQKDRLPSSKGAAFAEIYASLDAI
ncbi:hypothetical protein D1224_14405 [Henriciella barbarensis]|uniref:Uncharacterized protein n=2 Tax=Henriciella barbarensis TaxID=86342 RepID=A0A399QMX5_9PROT|nr:hypothetical protein D1224_14405 [Henriciella barbarensis]